MQASEFMKRLCKATPERVSDGDNYHAAEVAALERAGIFAGTREASTHFRVYNPIIDALRAVRPYSEYLTLDTLITILRAHEYYEENVGGS